MQYANKNTNYIQTNEKLENQELLLIVKIHFLNRKNCDFPEFLKVVKFAFSINACS